MMTTSTRADAVPHCVLNPNLPFASRSSDMEDHYTDIHFWKITSLVRRFTDPSLAASFLRKQAPEAQLTPEAKAACRKKRAAQRTPREAQREQQPKQQPEGSSRYVQWTTPTFYNYRGTNKFSCSQAGRNRGRDAITATPCSATSTGRGPIPQRRQ
jgi:hypothetical protein